VRINSKKEENKRRYELLVRADAGQFDTGYEIHLQPGWLGGVGSLGAGPQGSGGGEPVRHGHGGRV